MNLLGSCARLGSRMVRMNENYFFFRARTTFKLFMYRYCVQNEEYLDTVLLPNYSSIE